MSEKEELIRILQQALFDARSDYIMDRIRNILKAIRFLGISDEEIETWRAD